MSFFKAGLIGCPVYHSRSPLIYAELFKKHGIDGSFSVIEITESGLPRIREIVSKRGLNAFAVTMPHKKAIIQYLDEISPDARELGSVNFVTVKNGRLCGYSTDGDGFLSALTEAGASVKHKNVHIYGYGGAAASVVYSLKQVGANITVSGRDVDKVNAFSKTFGISKAEGINLEECDIFINATPLGMQGKHNFSDFVFLDNAESSLYVCDLVYAPLETELIKNAKKRGLKTQNGIPMLKKQAEIAFNIMLKSIDD